MEKNITILTEDTLDDTTFLNTSLGDAAEVNTSDAYSSNIHVLRVHFWMRMVTIPSLATLGIIGNVFSLTVWTMQTSFNVTVFLFRYLGVWDTLYLVVIIVHCLIFFTSGLDTQQASIIFHAGNYVQLVSVHVTLLIAVSRWIAVTFPFQASRLLTACWIYLICAFMLMYCGAIEACDIVYTSHHIDINMIKRHFLVKQSVGLILPLLLLLIFNLCVLWTATRRPGILSRTEAPSTKLQRLKQSGKTPALSVQIVASSTKVERFVTDERNEANPESYHEEPPEEQQQIEHQQQRQQQQREQQQHFGQKRFVEGTEHVQQTSVPSPRRRHMVTAVLLVSLCSFIAYPIGCSLQLYIIFYGDPHKQSTYIRMYMIHICHVINSSLNVFIYWFFVSRFRQLATGLRNRIRACRH